MPVVGILFHFPLDSLCASKRVTGLKRNRRIPEERVERRKSTQKRGKETTEFSSGFSCFVMKWRDPFFSPGEVEKEKFAAKIPLHFFLYSLLPSAHDFFRCLFFPVTHGATEKTTDIHDWECVEVWEGEVVRDSRRKDSCSTVLRTEARSTAHPTGLPDRTKGLENRTEGSGVRRRRGVVANWHL